MQGKPAQDDKAQKLQDARWQLLQQIELDAGFNGIGRQALLQASEACKIDRHFALALFDDGHKQAIAHHYWEMRIASLSHALAQPHQIIGTTDKVAYGIKLFLQGNADAPHQGKTALQYCSASLLLPPHVTMGLKHIWRVSDVIWQFAGDISTDHNYYSKRILLSQVLMMSLPFYWQDSSDHHAATEEFVAGRLKNVVMVGKNIGMASKKISSAGEAIAQLLKIISPYSETKTKLRPLVKGAMAYPMPNLRMKNESVSSAQTAQHPALVTRKLLKNFVKRRAQKFASTMMPQS